MIPCPKLNKSSESTPDSVVCGYTNDTDNQSNLSENNEVKSPVSDVPTIVCEFQDLYDTP